MNTQSQVGGAVEGETRSSRPAMWRRFVAAALVASATTLVVDMAPADAAVCPADEPAAESRFVSKLNALRHSRGLRTLAVNTAITGPADDWSEHMSAQNRLYHARDTSATDGVSATQDYVYQVGRAVPDWSRVAENVGVSSLSSCGNIASTVDGLHNAFVNSPGHFKNMIGDFNQVGIGVHTDADQLWVTVRFAKGSLPKAPTLTQAQLDEASRYIKATYELFLGRTASDADVSRWSAIVAGGDRARLARALAVSNEWAGSRVGALYETILHRIAEPSGRQGWVDAISRGTQLEYVAAGIYGSQERFNLSGGTNRGYVEGLYQDILGRTADPGGRDDWVHQLNRGSKTRTQVAAGFYNSRESRTDRVNTLYQEILNRPPDAAGLAYWAGRLPALGDVALASSLATSQEYWNIATR